MEEIIMVDRKLVQLLQHIPEEGSVTAQELADLFMVSSRTIRTRINDLNDILKGNGASIGARPHKGYFLIISDKDLYTNFCNEIMEKSNESVPQTSDERVKFLIKELLDAKDYILIDSLGEKLFIRRNTIVADLKKAEEILERYRLTLERKPNYGIKLRGTEIHKRQFILYNLGNKEREAYFNISKERLQQIAACVMGILRKYDITLSEIALEGLLIRIFVTCFRVKQGFYIDENIEQEIHADIDFAKNVAGDILSGVGKEFGISFGESEIIYVASYLAGNSYLKQGIFDVDSLQNVVIPDYIQLLVSQMLTEVKNSYNLDLRSNLDLWMSLCQHLIPLEIRIKYGITVTNPLISEIMTNYMYAFAVASQASVALARAWETSIPHGEIGYLAVLFALALDKDSRPKHQKKVLLICDTKRSGSQLLANKLKREFYDDIDTIDICDASALEDKDIEWFDCIFTTVPIKRQCSKPVLELIKFLNAEEIINARHMLRHSGDGIFQKYFPRELFWSGLKAKNWHEAVHEICEELMRSITLPEGFEEAIYEREEMASTDFGNLVAMPHPITTMTETSFVAVGIFEKPIFWKNNDVQVVFLTSISKTTDLDIQNFYTEITDFIMDENKVRYLIEHPSFETMRNTWK
jgi:lichenan operon transcriptional antiterminator